MALIENESNNYYILENVSQFCFLILIFRSQTFEPSESIETITKSDALPLSCNSYSIKFYSKLIHNIFSYIK